MGLPIPAEVLEALHLATPSGHTVADVALESGVIDQARYDQILLEHEQEQRAGGDALSF